MRLLVVGWTTVGLKSMYTLLLRCALGLVGSIKTFIKKYIQQFILRLKGALIVKCTMTGIAMETLVIDLRGTELQSKCVFSDSLWFE